MLGAASPGVCLFPKGCAGFFRLGSLQDLGLVSHPRKIINATNSQHEEAPYRTNRFKHTHGKITYDWKLMEHMELQKPIIGCEDSNFAR